VAGSGYAHSCSLETAPGCHRGTRRGRPASIAGADAQEAIALTTGLCELTLETAEPSKLAAFYTQVFGWDELSREDDRIWLGCGSRARLGLWSPGPKEFGDRGGHHVHFALSVRPGQLDALSEKLDGLGVECEGPVEHDGGDRSLYFEDPEGNVVEAWDFFERGEGASDGVEALK
jgi:catechol-2,3-dioxygenase